MRAKKRWWFLAALSAAYAALPWWLEIPALQSAALREVHAGAPGLLRVARVEIGRDLSLRLRDVTLPALRGVRIGAVEISLPRRFADWLGRRAGGAAWAVAAPVQRRLELDGAGVRLRNLAGAFAGFRWTLGEVRARGAVEQRGASWHAALHWTAEALAAHDESHRRAVEGVRLEGELRGVLASAADARFEVEALAARGEALWNRFYADLSAVPVSWRGRATLAAGHVAIDDAVARIAGVGELRGGGTYALASGAAQARIALEIDGLSRLYDLGVRQVLRARHPRIDGTRLRGALRGDVGVAVDDQGRWTATGEIHLRDVHASGVDPSFLLAGLELDLPLLLGDGALPAGRQRGALSARSLQLGGIDVAPPAVGIVVEPNRLRAEGEVRFPVLDGSAVLSDLRAGDLAADAPRASFALRLEALRLEGLADAVAWPGLSGSLDGELTRVEVSADRISSAGELVARVFGGTVRARDLAVDQLWSTVPEIGMNVDFEEISLDRLTDIVTFGRMTGVIRGGVRDLVVVNREPVAFSAWLETVPRAGVPQIIGVDAVRQISILGGASGDPISQGLLRFFDEYRYAKMGFRCTLHNDLFELQGIERRGGREHLVIGATLPPRIDVISHSQRISFSEMVSRLREAGSVEEGEPPGQQHPPEEEQAPNQPA